MIKNMYLSSCKQPLFSASFTELEFSREIFEKCLNIKFHDNESGIYNIFLLWKLSCWILCIKSFLRNNIQRNLTKDFMVVFVFKGII
jgi:hypothetical protein